MNRKHPARTALAAALFLASSSAGAIDTVYDPNPEPVEIIIAAHQVAAASLAADSPADGPGQALRDGRAEMKAQREEEKRNRAPSAQAVSKPLDRRATTADRAPGAFPDLPPNSDVPTPKDPARKPILKSQSATERNVIDDSAPRGATSVE